MRDQQFEYGKVPPQAVELEASLIGACMMDQGLRLEIMNILTPEMFYKQEHQLIFKAISNMFNRGVQAIDMLTVTEEMRKTGELEAAGGAYYIAQTTRFIGPVANSEYHAAIIKSKWMKRRVIEILHTGYLQAYEEDYDGGEIVDNIGLELVNIDTHTNSYHISSASKENAELVKKIKSGEIKKVGVPTLISDVDNVINGLQSPDLIIIAGRPGMGKTAFALSVLSNICINQGLPAVFFSLEMSASQLDFRLESMHSGIPYSNLQKGKISSLDNRRYEEAQKKVSNAPIYIDDDPDLTPEKIRTRALKLKMQHNIRAVFVDYIQLIDSGKKSYSRENEISKVSRSLKKLAKELDVPVIALSQLNREVEKRKPPEPFISDLRESGSLEQDSDIIILMYRPEYYDIPTIEKDGVVISTQNMCSIHIAKHRNGRVGKVPVKFNSHLMQFSDYGEPEAVQDEMPF